MSMLSRDPSLSLGGGVAFVTAVSRREEGQSLGDGAKREGGAGGRFWSLTLRWEERSDS